MYDGFEEFIRDYDKETSEVLHSLRLARNRRMGPQLRSGKHYVRSVSGPFTSYGHIFMNAFFRSNHNVQLLDNSMHMTYIINYAAGAEGRAEVIITTKDDKGNVVNVERQRLINKKIASNKSATEKS